MVFTRSQSKNLKNNSNNVFLEILKKSKLKYYGKGILVYYPNNVGIKYVDIKCQHTINKNHTGWWMAKHSGWFFKKDNENWLKKNGGKFMEKVVNKKVSLKGMKLSKYGRGWLLKPKKTSKKFGEKYFHNGWWMPKHESWFFKQAEHQWLLDNGAQSTKVSIKKTPVEKKTPSKKVSLKGMKLSKYGRGWLLKPKKTNKKFGEKYFHNGWWMPKHEAWFFKQAEYNWLAINTGKSVCV